MLKQKRSSQASFEGLKNIPEESEETSTLQSRKISNSQKGFSTPQRNVIDFWTKQFSLTFPFYRHIIKTLI